MTLFVPPNVPALDENGVPLSGAKYYFYLSGTTTPATVYSDAALSTPHANPVVADSAGRFAPIFFAPETALRAVLKKADNSTITKFDFDPIPGAQTTGEVYIIGSIPDNPAMAAANKAVWDAAMARLPATGGRIILPTPGVHYLSANVDQPAGGATLVLTQGASYAGAGAPQVSAIEYERTAGYRFDRFSGGTAPDAYNTIGEIVNLTNYGDGGHYGRRLNYAVKGDHDVATFDIADSVQAVWEKVNGGFCLTRWDVAISPINNGGADEYFAVYSFENNPVNRYGDEGYSRTRSTMPRWLGGFQHVPETQDFTATGLGNLGYNVLFGFLIGHSPLVNTLGKYAKTYNGYMSEADAIAPAGVFALANGNTGASADDPKAVVDMVNTWKMGIDFRDATFRDATLGNNVAMRFDTEHMLSWKRISDSQNLLIFGNSFDRFFINALDGAEGVQFGTPNLASVMARIYASGATPNAYTSLIAGTDATEIKAEGAATNADIILTPKGTGKVRVGTFTGSADAPVTGYITIRDAGGTDRKLAVIA